MPGQVWSDVQTWIGREKLAKEALSNGISRKIKTPFFLL